MKNGSARTLHDDTPVAKGAPMVKQCTAPSTYRCYSRIIEVKKITNILRRDDNLKMCSSELSNDSEDEEEDITSQDTKNPPAMQSCSQVQIEKCKLNWIYLPPPIQSSNHRPPLSSQYN